jgi:hypothetical protein
MSTQASTTGATTDGLRQSLDAVGGLETHLAESLARLSAETSRYLEAPMIIGELRSRASTQRDALQTHLQTVSDTEIPPVGTAVAAALEHTPQPDANGTVAALRAVAAELTEIAFGYAVLHALAHRSFDVATANLADQHRTNYLDAAQLIHQALGDVAVEELQDVGHVCRCQCPACGPGICICWHVHGGSNIAATTAEGIVVRTPRAGSNAERAGLRRGDVILAVGDHEVRSYEEVRQQMAEHQPGESVKLRVRRGIGEPEDLIITR